MSDVLLNDNYEYDNEEDVQLSHSDETVKLTLWNIWNDGSGDI